MILLQVLAALGLLGPVERIADEPETTSHHSSELAPEVQSGLDEKLRVVVTFEDAVDVAALRRRSSSSKHLMRTLRTLRARQRKAMLAEFRRAGLNFENVRGFTLVSAVALTSTEADIAKMASMEGVVRIKPATENAKKPSRRIRKSPSQ